MKIDEKLSASGGEPPDPSPGALPPDSRYRLALHALAMVRPLGKFWIRPFVHDFYAGNLLTDFSRSSRRPLRHGLTEVRRQFTELQKVAPAAS